VGLASPSPEFLGDASAERSALETILGRIFVKAVKVDRQDPGEVGQTELAANSMDLAKGVGRGAAAIVGDLPCKVILLAWILRDVIKAVG
jgi:hypothetical protein